MLTTQQKLDRLKNYRTRYELIASHPDGRKLLIRYTARQGRRGLLDALTMDAARVCQVLGADDIHWGKRAADGGHMGEWTVKFSGRTQREAILGGELPFYANFEKAEKIPAA